MSNACSESFGKKYYLIVPSQIHIISRISLNNLMARMTCKFENGSKQAYRQGFRVPRKCENSQKDCHFLYTEKYRAIFLDSCVRE